MISDYGLAALYSIDDHFVFVSDRVWTLNVFFSFILVEDLIYQSADPVKISVVHSNVIIV